MSIEGGASRGRRRLRLAALVLAGFGLVVGVGASACSPLIALNELLVPEDGYVRHRAITYGEGPRHQLDVYVPATVTGGAAAPVVVFFYGGAWRSGSREYYPFIGEALARRGYVVVVPDYRTYPDVRFPGFVEDAAQVLRWTQDRIAAFGGRPDAVVLMGHSAGAHIGAMLITDDRYLAGAGVDPGIIRGFVGLAGPYDFDPLRFRLTRPIFAEATAPVMPVDLISGDEPPMLLLHGEADRTVYPENSRTLASRVWTSGGKARLVEYPEKGHIGIVLAMAPPFRDEEGPYGEVARFLAATTQRPAPH